ncbi:hypothetical protein F5Y01DRAFT_316725 [Xylaria sp. FL0043]|nr:hypothetical protein F5Y01DRAFT_316725 [Xylaria sp. FL0043]
MRSVKKANIHYLAASALTLPDHPAFYIYLFHHIYSNNNARLLAQSLLVFHLLTITTEFVTSNRTSTSTITTVTTSFTITIIISSIVTITLVVGNTINMISLSLAAKALITWLMIQMLYTAEPGIFALGMLMCCVFGNTSRFCQPSLDFFLFIWTAMVSKHIETLPEPHESGFDAHILMLAGLYLVTGDKLRYTLLGAWLPYFYGADNYAKCGAYLFLAAVIPILPHLRRAYQVIWPTISTMLCNSIQVAFFRLCISAIKTIESITPCSLPPFHPPPPPTTFSISTVITTANIEPEQPEQPEQPKAAMIDSSTQTEPLPATDQNTQYEEGWLAQPVCGFDIKTKWTWEMREGGYHRVPVDDEPSPIKRRKPSRSHRSSAPRVPSPFPLPPDSPLTQAIVPADAFTSELPAECAPIPNTDTSIEAQHNSLSSVASPSPSSVPSPTSNPVVFPPTVESDSIRSESVDDTPIEKPVLTAIPTDETTMTSGPVAESPIEEPVSIVIPFDQTAIASETINETLIEEPVSIVAPIDQRTMTSGIVDETFIEEPVSIVIPIDQTAVAPGPVAETPVEEPVSIAIHIDRTTIASETVDESPIEEPVSVIIPVDQTVMASETVEVAPLPEPISIASPVPESVAEPVSIIQPVDPMETIPEGIEEGPIDESVSTVTPVEEMEWDFNGLDLELDSNAEWTITDEDLDLILNDVDFTLLNTGEGLENIGYAETNDVPIADADDVTATGVDNIPFIEDFPSAPGFSFPPLGDPMDNTSPDVASGDEPPNTNMVLDVEPAPASESHEIDLSELSSLPPTPRDTSPAPPSPSAASDPIPAMPDAAASPARPMLTAVSISNRLPPLPPLPSPAEPPIAFNMAASPAAPKLDSRFILTSAPRQLSCNIRALQPGYRPARQLSEAPRTKIVYIDDYEGNDGYRQKALWHARGLPPLDEEALAQVEQRMNQAGEEAKRDWPSRRAGIEEQTALDLTAKKQRDKEKMEAIHEAQRAAAAARPPRKKKEKPASCFITPKRRGRP